MIQSRPREAYSLVLAGISFEVHPTSSLTPADRADLDRLQRASTSLPETSLPPVTVELIDEAPWSGARAGDFLDRAPAEVAATPEGRVRLMHRRYLAELDLAASHVRLQRLAPDIGLLVALRIALAARLPILGGLPLHAAGVVLDGRGLVFFGPSGAGKSTLAATRPSGIVSHELVAVMGSPWRLAATGFYAAEAYTTEPAPLHALIELAKGPELVMEPLAPQLALRRLLGQVLVPPSTVLWTSAIAVAGRLVHGVPVYRMRWSPAEPPWARFSENLARTGKIA